MPRLESVSTDEAQGVAKEIYEQINRKMGSVPNIFTGFGRSPVALKAYTALDDIIAEGELAPQEREIVRLATSQFNGCDYCVAAHTMVARMQGLDDEQIAAVRRGEPAEPKHRALVGFTNTVLESTGFVDDEDLQAFRRVGYGDQHVLEVVTIIAQKTLSNLFNHINDTELDFPKAPEI